MANALFLQTLFAALGRVHPISAGEWNIVDPASPGATLSTLYSTKLSMICTCLAEKTGSDTSFKSLC